MTTEWFVFWWSSLSLARKLIPIPIAMMIATVVMILFISGSERRCAKSRTLAVKGPGAQLVIRRDLCFCLCFRCERI
jgi:hypothetical protein